MATSIGSYKGTPIYAGTDAEVAAQVKAINDKFAGSQPDLGSANPPSSADNITTTTSPKLPKNTPVFPDISKIGGLSDYYKSLFATADTQATDAKAERDRLMAEQTKNAKPLLDKIKATESPVDVRSKALAETGVNAKQYFADERARIAEIDSLNKDYNDAVAQRDTQIAATHDKLASNDFINNQVAQINRNAAPVLNQKAANINSKAAALQASQGLFQEAQAYANDAVNNATADLKFNLEMYDVLMKSNQPQIDALDSEYKDALNYGRAAAEKAYNLAYDEKTQIGQLLIDNPRAGINIATDSLQTAQAKVAQAGGSLAARQETRLSREAGSAGTSVGFSSQKIESSIREDAVALLDQVDTGDTTVEKAYTKLRKLYSPSEATDDALKSLLGISAPASTGSQASTITPPRIRPVDNAPNFYKTSGFRAPWTDAIYNFLFK